MRWCVREREQCKANCGTLWTDVEVWESLCQPSVLGLVPLGRLGRDPPTGEVRVQLLDARVVPRPAVVAAGLPI